MTVTTRHPPEEVLLGFARALRAAGVAVTADRERTYLEAVAAVGLDDQPAVYFAGRATLCASPADLERYDLVYTAWFSGLGATESPTAQGADDPDVVRAQASSTEVLRHRDVATLTRRERESLAALFGALRSCSVTPTRHPRCPPPVPAWRWWRRRWTLRQARATWPAESPPSRPRHR